MRMLKYACTSPVKGRIRADIVHRRITAMGFRGGDRTTRRAVA